MLFENVGKYLQNSESFMPANGEGKEEREREQATKYLFVVFKLLSSYALKAFQFQTKIRPTYSVHYTMNADNIVCHAIGLSSIRF